jgi:tetratricopeptide (TPR) repeat protein
MRRTKKIRTVLTSVIIALILAAGAGFGIYLLMRDTRSASELFREGEKAFKSGNYDRAIELYRKGISKEPGSSVGYNLLGMAYRFKYNEIGDRKFKNEEIRAFEKAILLDPRNHTALINLGVTLFYEGQKKKAAYYLKESLKVYPENPERLAIEDMIRQCE